LSWVKAYRQPLSDASRIDRFFSKERILQIRLQGTIAPLTLFKSKRFRKSKARRRNLIKDPARDTEMT